MNRHNFRQSWELYPTNRYLHQILPILRITPLSPITPLSIFAHYWRIVVYTQEIFKSAVTGEMCESGIIGEMGVIGEMGEIGESGRKLA